MVSRKRTNNLSNTLLSIAMVLMCMIFMANSWVSSEIEETKKIGAPAPNPSTQSPRRNMLAHNGTAYQRTSHLTQDASSEVETYKKTKKRQKIIYEIPLDDDNLVQ